MKTPHFVFYLGLLFCISFSAVQLKAQTRVFSVTVNTTDDTDDGRCTTDHCSYREALNAVNGFQGDVSIFFDIPGNGFVRRIEVTSDLPRMSTFGAVLRVDGTTQSNGAQVIIDGNSRATYGLDLLAASTTIVDGLTFDNFRSAGIFIGIESEDCTIGTTQGGNTFTNSQYGIINNGLRTTIINNFFQENDISGVYVTGTSASATVGEIGNDAADNTFIGHAIAGIEVNENADFCNIFRNRFYCNDRQGIQNFNDANGGIEPPTVTAVSSDQVSGTTSVRNAYIQVYARDPNQSVCSSDNPCQGNIFIGATVADGLSWTLNSRSFETAVLNNYEITATQTVRVVFGAGVFYQFTSEFSDCFTQCPTYELSFNTIQPSCPGERFSITTNVSSSDPDAEALNFFWVAPDGSTSTSQNITGTLTGTYTLRATNSCASFSETVVITPEEIPPTSITASFDGPICELSTLQLDANSEKVIYEWTGPNGFSSDQEDPVVSTSADLSMAGDYFLTTKTPDNGCPGPSDMVTVVILPRPVLNDTSLTVCTNGATSATFDLTSVEDHLTSGDTNIFVQWFQDSDLRFPISTPQSYTSAPGSAYAVGIEGNCVSDAVEIPLIFAPELNASLRLSSVPDCSNPNGGGITTIVSGGTAPFNFDWSDPASDVQNPTGLASGLYTVTITDALGCVTTEEIEVPVADLLSIRCSRLQDVSFVGGNDGQVRIVYSTNFAPPASIRLTGPVDGVFSGRTNNPDTLGNLVAGDYQIEVTDANGCIAFCEFSISEPDCSNFNTDINVFGLSCGGSSDGTIRLSVGGVDPIQYDWANDAFDGQSTLTDLPAGSYPVTITDAVGCSESFDIQVSEPDTLLLNCSVLQNETSLGAADGIAQLIIENGQAPFTLVWTGPQSDTLGLRIADTVTLQDLSAGTYQFIIEDSNGCQDSCTLDILSPDCTDLSFNTIINDVSCNGNSTGSIELSIVGGTTPYSIDWDGIDSLTDQTLAQNLPAGSYTIRVQDSVGCVFSDVAVINEPSALSLDCSVTSNALTVGGNQGAVSFAFSGGTASYAIQLNGPSPQNTALSSEGNFEFTGLLAGEYTIILTDQNNCQISCAFVIEAPDCSALRLNARKTDISCTDADDGTISITVDGAVTPVNFDWDQDQFDGQSSLSGLAPGIYTVTVTDSIGCSDIIRVPINEPDPLVINCSVRNPLSANNAEDGSVFIEFNGGTAPYNLSWTGAETGFQSISDIQDILIENLRAGNYTFTLSDVNGCSQNCSIDLTPINCSTLGLQLNVSAITCFDANDGQIIAIASGGTLPYTFAWNDGLNGDNRSALGPGTYEVTLTDALACTQVASVTLTEPNPLQIFCSNPRGVSTDNGNDGQIDLRISGGSPPFIVQIPALNDTSFTASAAGSFTVLGLGVGNYAVNVTDANGCEDNCEFNIPTVDCSNFSISLDVVNPNCPDDNSGSIVINTINGSAPFNYDWSNDNFDGNSILQNLSDGSYSVTVTDDKGCIAIQSIDLETQNESPRLDFGQANSICSDGCAVLDLDLQGQAPFRLVYEVSDGNIAQSFELLSDETDNILEICASDFPAASSTINVRLISLADAVCETALSENRVINILSPGLNVIDTILCPGGGLFVNGTIYDEGNPSGIEIIENGAQNGCDSIIEVNLFFTTEPSVSNISTDCNLNNGSFQISFEILGLAPYQISGVNGNVFGNTFISNELTSTGSIPITVVDGFGCQTSFSVDAPDCTRGTNCLVRAGTLAPISSSLCRYDSIKMSTLGDEVLDTNSILLFVIHDGSLQELGNILLSNTDGDFFFRLPLQLNTDYHTAVIAGRNNGFDALDLSDPCLDIFLGPAIRFGDAPDRPRFIQGQDTLCVGQDLILFTEQYADANIQYEWITPLGDTIRTDSNSIQFNNVGSELAGNFSVRATNGSCPSPIFTPHQFVTIDFPILFAGEDQLSCGLNQVALIADPISFGDGEWSTTNPDVIIINPNSDSTVARNLPLGTTPFIWTIAANECVSQDTVLVTYLETPVVEDDFLAFEPGLTRITFDPFVNDRIEGYPLNDTTVQIISQPEVGVVQFLEDDLVFEYTAELSDVESVAFEYIVCSPACNNVCDTATVIIDIPDVILEVPDGIIQGRANQGLVIGNLDAFPDNEIIITNRWGVVVFRQDNYSNIDPWKGTHNGADLPQGTYYMYMRIEGKRDVVRKAIHVIVRN